MRVLLDTNIIIHREASNIVRKDIGTLFNWLDRLKYEKCVHPLTAGELKKHKDPKVVATMSIKLDSYTELKTEAPESQPIEEIRATFDKTPNDHIDTSLLKEVYADRVNLLITEDRKVHAKAQALGIAERVFTIDGFLEKVVAENPDLADYKVLSVKKELFGKIDLADPFFDTFKADYPGFAAWFNRKADEVAYICKAENGTLLAFLYIKVEDGNEPYSDITPPFIPKKRLKIGTFKVEATGYKLGERFVKIIIDNAMRYDVQEIYVTIFDREPQQRLISLLKDWGFVLYGDKKSSAGKEEVYVRDFTPQVDAVDPSLTYPYVSLQNRVFIVPIYPEYHTELFPDSILRTESPADYVESKPNRNALSKVYISRSIKRDLRTGDIIVFYRTKSDTAPAYYTAVTTTVGVVQNVITGIKDKEHFIELCRKRSVFTDAELAQQWDHKPGSRPFVVNFLYVYTFRKKLTLRDLKELGILTDAPRGFEVLSKQAFQTLLEKSNANQRFIIN